MTKPRIFANKERLIDHVLKTGVLTDCGCFVFGEIYTVNQMFAPFTSSGLGIDFYFCQPYKFICFDYFHPLTTDQAKEFIALLNDLGQYRDNPPKPMPQQISTPEIVTI